MTLEMFRQRLSASMGPNLTEDKVVLKIIGLPEPPVTATWRYNRASALTEWDYDVPLAAQEEQADGK